MNKNPSAKKTCIDSVETSIGGKLREVRLEHQVAILEATPDFVGYADAKTQHILYINQAGRKMTGLTKDEDVTKLKISDIHPEWTNQLFDKEILPTAIRQGVWNGECAFRNCDGREIPVMMVLISHKAINGEVERFSTISRDITNRKQAEALQESEERYRALVENASDIVFRLDDTGHITFANPAALRIMGYEEKEIIGRHYPTFIRPDMREEAMKFFVHQFVKRIPNTYSEYPIIVKDGREIWLGQNTQLIFQDGKVVAFQAVARDITARKQIEEELRRNQDVTERLAQEIEIIAEIGKVVGSTLEIEAIYERFAAEVRKLIPFDRIAVNLHDLDQGLVRTVYASGEYIAGRQPGDTFPLKGSVSEVVVRTRAGMFSHPLSVEEMDKRFPGHSATIQAGMRSLLCVPLISRDEVIASLHFRTKKPNAYTEQDLRLAERIGEQIAGAIANAQLYAGLRKAEQELKENEQRYRELSIIDDLTQLYNFRHFYFQLKIELDRSNRYEQPLTLLLLDLDNFKAFNDTYGHVEGDQVLQRLGQVVKRCLRETDFAYRYGGEEFTILLPMTTSVEGVVTAERIRTEFKKETFSPASGQEVHVTVSTGLAQYKPQEEMKVFVHRVDQLMYQGKKSGKDRVCSESSPQEQFKWQSSIQFDIEGH